MTENEWKRETDGPTMLGVVADRLTPRKWALMACAVVRRVLPLLPEPRFAEAVDFVERHHPQAGNAALDAWRQLVNAEVAGARLEAEREQLAVVSACDPSSAGSGFEEEVGDQPNPPVPLYQEASLQAAESVSAAIQAAEHAATAVQLLLFSATNSDRLEVSRRAVFDAMNWSGTAGVLASVALDLKRKADDIADRVTPRNARLLYGKASGMVELVDEVIEQKTARMTEDKESVENIALAHILREQLGNPFRPSRFEPAWRTETVLALAEGIEADRAFDRMPILADALEEAGCDERPMLDHLRGPGPHARGCWVLDLILNREPDLFDLPPLTESPRCMRLGPHTRPADGMA